MRKNYFWIMLTVLALLSGCAHDDAIKKPAADLMSEADTLAADKKMEKAAERYMMVRTYYPGDQLARKALLALGDLYYDNKEYELALANYHEFRMLYPTDVEAGYSLYRMGLCFFSQMQDHDRDQTQTRQAIKFLEDFIRSYPNSPYITDAENKLNESRRRLALKEIYVAKFYMHKREYTAAAKRLEAASQNYSGLGMDEEIHDLLREALDKAERQEKRKFPECCLPRK